MEFDSEEKIDEHEIDALGIKKKDNADVDVDLPEDDAVVPPGLEEEEEKDEVDGGIFGDDKELEEYMLGGYEETY